MQYILLQDLCRVVEAFVAGPVPDEHVSAPFASVALSAGGCRDEYKILYLLIRYDPGKGVRGGRLIVAKRCYGCESRGFEISFVLVVQRFIVVTESRDRKAHGRLRQLNGKVFGRHCKIAVGPGEIPAELFVPERNERNIDLNGIVGYGAVLRAVCKAYRRGGSRDQCNDQQSEKSYFNDPKHISSILDCGEKLTLGVC